LKWLMSQEKDRTWERRSRIIREGSGEEDVQKEIFERKMTMIVNRRGVRRRIRVEEKWMRSRGR
jgi:hypothetical protein